VQPALGDPAWAGGWAGGPTEVPSNPKHSVILCPRIRLRRTSQEGAEKDATTPGKKCNVKKSETTGEERSRVETR